MGIEGLFKFLRDNNSGPLSLPPSEFSGARVAIDLNGIAFASYCAVYKSEVTGFDGDEVNREKVFYIWTKRMIDTLCFMFRNGMTPLIVVDGPHSEGKDAEINKRRDQFNKSKERAEKFEEYVSSLDIFEGATLENFNKIKNLRANLGRPSRRDFFRLGSILRCLGFPVLQAKNDAEALCCMLVQSGKADIVYSPDSDCLVYNVPVIITGQDKKEKNQKYTVYFKDKVLQDLGLGREKFTDLCIASGCDYNTSVKGYAIKTLYKLSKSLEDGQTLENKILEKGKETEQVKFSDCRRMFYETEVDTSLPDTLEEDMLEPCGNFEVSQPMDTISEDICSGDNWTKFLFVRSGEEPKLKKAFRSEGLVKKYHQAEVPTVSSSHVYCHEKSESQKVLEELLGF